MREIILSGRGPNTMSLAMLEVVEREIDAAGDEPLLVTGEGTAFSAGLDLDALRDASPDLIASLLAAMGSVVRKLFLHPAPTVALVNGHAVAGGCLVVQCCDWRVGVSDPLVRIGMTGVAIGLTYPPFVPGVFQQRIAAPNVETILLGADRYAPDAAVKMGLLDELAPRPFARQKAIDRLEARAKLPRAAYAGTKRTLREPAFLRALADRAHFENEVLPEWTSKLAPKA